MRFQENVKHESMWRLLNYEKILIMILSVMGTHWRTWNRGVTGHPLYFKTIIAAPEWS